MVSPFDQSNVYVPAGEGVILTVPFGVVQELNGVVLPRILIATLLFDTVADVLAVQPFAPVTVTV